MANKTRTDQGNNNANYRVQRDGADFKVTVIIKDTDGKTEAVHLDKDEVIANTTAAERTGLKDGFNALYAFALTKKGWA